MLHRPWLILISLLVFSAQAEARTVWRCLRDGTVSLSTAPEPGSKCSEQTLDDDAAFVPNLWGSLGVFQGNLYRREQDGRKVYGTRALPGAVKVQEFTVATPAYSSAHEGLGKIGALQLDVYRREFRAAARKTGLDEAWLRSIAQTESAFNSQAVSAKGAIGIMQLMPEVIGDYGVSEPTSASQSIMAGARHLKVLETRYGGDRILVAAAYNAGIGAVTQYGGVPPYAETLEYVTKVRVLYTRYRKALGLQPRSLQLEPAK
ncbi:MAG: lytic transglycosylase domain-containing protein [Dokdonella sp.]